MNKDRCMHKQNKWLLYFMSPGVYLYTCGYHVNVAKVHLLAITDMCRKVLVYVVNVVIMETGAVKQNGITKKRCSQWELIKIRLQSKQPSSALIIIMWFTYIVSKNGEDHTCNRISFMLWQTRSIFWLNIALKAHFIVMDVKPKRPTKY